MPKKKTEAERAVGKLISAIQKEWGKQIGESNEEFSMDVMSAAHMLLQARTVDGMRELLGPLTIRQYLGDVWVQSHPNVKPAIALLEDMLNAS